jgi:hypothetical protein
MCLSDCNTYPRRATVFQWDILLIFHSLKNLGRSLPCLPSHPKSQQQGSSGWLATGCCLLAPAAALHNKLPIQAPLSFSPYHTNTLWEQERLWQRPSLLARKRTVNWRIQKFGRIWNLVEIFGTTSAMAPARQAGSLQCCHSLVYSSISHSDSPVVFSVRIACWCTVFEYAT